MGYTVSEYMLPHILALVVSLGLAFFIYIKNPSNRINRLFSLLLFSFAVFAFGQSCLSMATDHGTALIWARVKLLGLIFFAPLFLHAVLVIADRRNFLLGRMKYLYLPSIFFLVALPTELLVNGVRFWQHDYDLELGPIGWAAIFLFLAYTSYATYVLAKKYAVSREIERRRTMPLLVGSLFLFVGFTVEFWRLVGALVGMGSGNVYPFFTLAGTVMCVLFSYTVVKYSVLEVEPLPEEGKTEIVESAVQAGMMVLSRGTDRSRQAFLSLVSNGCHGLIVTKQSPKEVKMEIGLERIPIVALDVEGRGSAVSPRKPEKLFLTLQEFFDKGSESVILIEDLNYLLAVNPLETMRSFLVNAVELVSSKGGRLIIELDEDKMNQDVLDELEHLVKYQYLMPVFTCLSNPIRKDILYFLEAGRASFTDIYKAAGVIFPSKVSFHLKSLKDAGLVEQGERRKYSLTWKGVTALEMVRDMEEMLAKKFEVE